ncbi:MAG: M23 family metallopeptidase, partial [Candidatus Methylomirabilales bacterium]
QRLTLPKAMVDLDAKTLKRVRREQRLIAGIWKKWQGGPYWWQAFVIPLEGTLGVTSEFGLRRILNGQPRRPHSGVDFQASLGTPVRASNGGLVVYTGELFFNGNSVILHHGGGLFTMYFHLQGYRVETGQEIAPGEILGWVGGAGRAPPPPPPPAGHARGEIRGGVGALARATGPHLHWGANLRGVRFDPRRLLELSLP